MVLKMCLMLLYMFLLHVKTLISEMQSERHGWAISTKMILCKTGLLFGIIYAHTHTHQFNGPLYGTTQVSRYQKSKTNLDFTEARDS